MAGAERGPEDPYPAGSVLAGRYRVVARIGEGGSGTVLRCRDENLDRDVAVKLLRTGLPAAEDRELRARFDREARVLARLRHPNLVTVHDRGVHEGAAFLVMEYLAGPDLGTIQRRDGLLPHPDVVRYGEQAAAALAYLHGGATPVVHRDIKPQNLVLDHAAVLKICDFGGVVLPAADLTRLTGFGVAVGTGLYMSPEQCRGERVGPASDVYSLGTVLYALLAGGPPFSDARGFIELARRIVTEPPEPLADRRPDAPAALTGLVHAMLAKDAADRPDAATVHDALAALAGTPPPPGRPARTAATAGRNPHAETAPADRDPYAGAATAGDRNPYTETAPAGRSPYGRAVPAADRDPDTDAAPSGRDREELAAAEEELRLGRHAEAYAAFTEIVHRFKAAGDLAHPTALAAEFGRIRAGAALGRQTEAAMRWYRLAHRARQALGDDHELVRTIVRYGESTTG